MLLSTANLLESNPMKQVTSFREALWIVPHGDVDAVQSTNASPGWFLFRKSFPLLDEPCSVRAVIAVESKYWLYVNGHCVVREGGLKRGQSPDSTYFDTMDLKPWICEGDNSLAILVWHFGKSGFSHLDSGRAGLLMELQDGEQNVIAASNATWRTATHPSYFVVDYLRDGYRLSESCLGFDAQLEPAGWELPGFDDSHWDSAVVAGEPNGAPWGTLVERGIPQWHWGERMPVKEEAREVQTDGRIVISGRLPANLQYVPWIEVEAPAGQRIEMWSDLGTGRMQSVYITKEGRQTHEAIGWMNGEDLCVRFPSKVRVHSFGFRETGYGATWAGGFQCDDEFLNRMYEKARQTLYITMRDTFMDCPCRERAQWPGDMVVQLGQIPYCLGQEGELLVRKGLLELIKWRRSDGVIFGPVPGNWDKELPAQILALLSRFGVWTYYMNTGDRSLLTEFLPAALSYLCVWEKTGDGVIAYREGGWDWVDWGERFDSRAILNAWYALALEGTALVAAELGERGVAEKLRFQLHDFQTAFRAVFCHGNEGIFSPAFPHAPDDRVQALAVLGDLYDQEQASALTALLFERRESSPYMEKYVLEALFQLHRPNLALERMRDRFGPMVASANSTLWEVWSADNDSTINHSWSGGVLTLSGQRIAGLTPTAPGWRRLSVRPQPGTLRNVEASAATPQGKAAVKLSHQAEGWSAVIEIPPGCLADIDLSQLGEKAGFFCKELERNRIASAGDIFKDVPEGRWEFRPVAS